MESIGKEQNDRNENEHDSAWVHRRACETKAKPGTECRFGGTRGTEVPSEGISVVGDGRSVMGCVMNAGDLSRKDAERHPTPY